jgi:Ni/Fe-hydrogenase subunit HybB-like protein
MKLIILRLIAVILLVIPGFFATYGFLRMKDAVFVSLGPNHMPWGMFLIGLLLFAVGIAFIGGWIFFRDRKRNYVAPRFKPKKTRKPRG